MHSKRMAGVGFIMFMGMVLSIAGSCLPVGLAQDKAASSPTARQRQVIVTITDTPGRYVTGLHKDQITILDNNMPQEVVNFEESSFPVSIGLLFNVSKGRYADLLAPTRKAFFKDFGVAEKVNEYFIMGFNMDAYFATDWAREPNQLSSGFDKLASVKPSKNATIYDALVIGIKKVSEGKHSKRALIMISDANDPGSNSKRDELLEMLKRNDTLVYAITVRSDVLPFLQSSSNPALERLCSLSGGFARSAKSTAEFLDLMEIISLELRHQYLIGFIPSGAEGDWHHLSFEAKTLVLQPSSSKKIEKVPLFARSREGYYLNH